MHSTTDKAYSQNTTVTSLAIPHYLHWELSLYGEIPKCLDNS